ncbi:MAG: putative DNA-binding protein [Amycolatopsis sp.]|nr:putative DNA-binding protein [Amycolatopsis sp.]
MCCMAGSAPTSPSPTFGTVLRTAREDRGISLRKLAELIGRKPSDSGLISRWETGERHPKPDEVIKISGVLGFDADEAIQLIASAESPARSRRLSTTLPERREHMNAVIRAEGTATKVTHVAPLLIPGVLQTYDVIRTIMSIGGVSDDEIGERVNDRIGRRHLITRRNPAQLTVLLGEAAIRQCIGGREIMADQLRYLLELAEMPNVELLAVPFSANWTPLLTGSFMLIDSDEAPSIVSSEQHRSGLRFEDPQDIASYRRDADAVREEAMSPADTAELIARVLMELETQDDNTA